MTVQAAHPAHSPLLQSERRGARVPHQCWQPAGTKGCGFAATRPEHSNTRNGTDMYMYVHVVEGATVGVPAERLGE